MYTRHSYIEIDVYLFYSRVCTEIIEIKRENAKVKLSDHQIVKVETKYFNIFWNIGKNWVENKENENNIYKFSKVWAWLFCAVCGRGKKFLALRWIFIRL